jgi:hypothetical protein
MRQFLLTIDDIEGDKHRWNHNKREYYEEEIKWQVEK